MQPEFNEMNIDFSSKIDVVDYWPELENDLTKVIWSHATNSKDKLQQALNGKTLKIL